MKKALDYASAEKYYLGQGSFSSEGWPFESHAGVAGSVVACVRGV